MFDSLPRHMKRNSLEWAVSFRKGGTGREEVGLARRDVPGETVVSRGGGIETEGLFSSSRCGF